MRRSESPNSIVKLFSCGYFAEVVRIFMGEMTESRIIGGVGENSMPFLNRLRQRENRHSRYLILDGTDLIVKYALGLWSRS